jgi:male-specific lethal 1
MDIDQMGGSTLQAMAEAVEGADVFLICMSNKYKHSPACRAGKRLNNLQTL